MRPLRSLPFTRLRSTPSSRAIRRTAGLAYGTLSGITVLASNGTGGVRGPAASGSTPGRESAITGGGAGVGAVGAGGVLAGGVARSSRASATGEVSPTIGSPRSSRGLAGFGAAAPASAASITATTAPSDTSSPTLTLTSFTTPSNGAGTSIVALSDSSVTRP